MFFFFYFPTFSLRIRELRESHDLTMDQLAKELDTTRGTISNFENLQRKPSLEMVIKIADYFNVSTDYILGRTDDPTFEGKRRN